MSDRFAFCHYKPGPEIYSTLRSSEGHSPIALLFATTNLALRFSCRRPDSCVVCRDSNSQLPGLARVGRSDTSCCRSDSFVVNGRVSNSPIRNSWPQVGDGPVKGRAVGLCLEW